MKYKLTLILVLISAFAFGQQSFTADRPGQTISAFNLPSGSFQVEAGFNYTGGLFFDDDDLDKSYTLPSVLLRYGVLDFLELRLENSYQFIDTHYGLTENGLADFKLGFKMNLRNGENHTTNYAIIGYVTFPQDDSSIGFSKHTAGLTFATTHQWSDKFQSAFNFGTIRDGNDIFHLIYSVSTSWALGEKFALFGEVYADTHTPEYSDSRTEVKFNLGASYMLNDRMQFDAFIGDGENS